MDKFVLLPTASRVKTTDPVHHQSCHTCADPDIAINDPDNIPFCFSVCSAHVPYLGIRAQIVCFSTLAGQVRILFFDKYLCVEVGMFRQDALKDGLCWVTAR